MTSNIPPVGALADLLYQVFGAYSYPGRSFCAFCYTPDEWEEIARTPIRALGMEASRKLLWETADHWESADVYRHYLPRLLEILAPPWRVEDLYPSHLSETLLALGFRRWNDGERNAVVDYLSALSSSVAGVVDEKDRMEWAAGLAALNGSDLALPGSLDQAEDRDD